MKVVVCPACGSHSIDGVERKIDRWPNPTVDYAVFRCRSCASIWMRDYVKEE